jgi:nicotinate-nucleotide--dimethylbenzimidazole phosphoribosyltransferase
MPDPFTVPEVPGSLFDAAVASIRPVDTVAEDEARARQVQLTKPPGSLGRLESAGIALSAVFGECPPPVPSPATVAVFAGDHGVLKQGVSPWPAEVTAQMVLNFAAGGAAVNVLARHVGAEVVVVDVGVESELPETEGLIRAKVRPGTADLSVEPAMTVAEARKALDVGAKVASDLVAGGNRCLLTGDMGIGNTTPSAALIGAFSGKSASEVTGRGTGIDDDRLARKTSVVAEALRRTSSADPLEVLASLGGLEIAGLAGFIVGGAAAGVPVLIDGVIAVAAAVTAVALAPSCRDYLFAGHRSSEPGATVGLAHLGLEPLLDLELRLGEGSGACLALPILQAAALVLREMATFESAAVTSEHE